MQSLIKEIPVDLLNFILVTLFSLLIGLSLRILHPDRDESSQFGTDRTFTFIGIWGYILYLISGHNQTIFIVGGIVLSMLLGVNYYFKISYFKNFGLTTIVIALITYCLAPLIYTQPLWLFLLIVVIVLALTELKESLMLISQKINKNEFITLAKFLAIAGVILPIVPDRQISPYLNITPYKIWLAVVVISTLSYLSYLLKKFVFKQSGTIITGILGGLYSSTAITVILARKSRETEEAKNQYASSIIFATAMMYLRILILIFIFNLALFRFILPYFLIMIVVSVLTGTIIFYIKKNENVIEAELYSDKNPLEFRVALIFMALFIAFSFITKYTIERFGTNGLDALSLVVGVTDIDPFLINLFQGKFLVASSIISIVAFQAIISNNIIKLIYALFLSGRRIKKTLTIGFLVIIIINIVLLYFI
jgi:uncharacterized membrane protein (DUF4010 family)